MPNRRLFYVISALCRIYKRGYPLDERLFLSLLAVLAGADSFAGIARFGEKKLRLLRRFLPFADGTPPHDTLGDIFATLDAEAYQRCFVDWVAALTKTPVEVIAIDGKTVRGSGAKAKSKAPIPMVSAFAARQRLVLAQTKVNQKPNEIVAIPACSHYGDRGSRRHHRRHGLPA